MLNLRAGLGVEYVHTMFSLIFRRLSLVVAVLLPAIISGNAQSPTLTGKVVAVEDGDSITILDKKKHQHKIELAGIDAPEDGQAFALKAQAFLSEQVMGQMVVVEGQRYDRNGRLIGKLLISGRDMNLEMLISGFAWHYKEYAAEQSDRDRQLYESAEFYARKSKFNLWSDAAPVAPWQFDRPKPVQTTPFDTAASPSTRGPELIRLADTPKPEKPAANTPTAPLPPAGSILGNKNSKIYHWEGCPGYTRVAEKNQVLFKTRAEAEAAGYRAAKNCN